jgi:hypothetical protein
MTDPLYQNGGWFVIRILRDSLVEVGAMVTLVRSLIRVVGRVSPRGAVRLPHQELNGPDSQAAKWTLGRTLNESRASVMPVYNGKRGGNYAPRASGDLLSRSKTPGKRQTEPVLW